MRKSSLAILLSLCLFTSAAARPDDKPAIDIVFCIDCSGSMGGVIETAKQKVWAIVNETARAKPAPVVRIGLIGYGNGEGPFRFFSLSDDLDEVYKNLMTFKDEGWGSEFVGLAIHRATDEMKWSEGKQVLRVMYVVGNETARQGPTDFDYARTAPAALARDIVVNAIYCGDEDHAAATPTWKELARLADGEYLQIAAEGGAIALATPFDDELGKLSIAMNATYLPYGQRALAAAQNQLAQDTNAAALGSMVAADRALAKAGGAYRNAGWDLVDASLEPGFDVSKLDEKELPDSIKQLDPEKRIEFIAQFAKDRAALQEQIKQLAAKRAEFIKVEIQKQGLTEDKAFDEAVKKSLVEQAQKKGFEFKD
jgi:hypothetical protein